MFACFVVVYLLFDLVLVSVVMMVDTLCCAIWLCFADLLALCFSEFGLFLALDGGTCCLSGCYDGWWVLGSLVWAFSCVSFCG